MKLKFVSYYKYTFIFEDETGQHWSCGGDHSDIYRFSVDPENLATPYKDEWLLDGLELTRIP